MNLIISLQSTNKSEQVFMFKACLVNPLKRQFRNQTSFDLDIYMKAIV